MNKSAKRNFGPCIVCGNQGPNKTYRKINAVPAYEELNQKLNKMLTDKYSNIIISIY